MRQHTGPFALLGFVVTLSLAGCQRSEEAARADSQGAQSVDICIEPPVMPTPPYDKHAPGKDNAYADGDRSGRRENDASQPGSNLPSGQYLNDDIDDSPTPDTPASPDPLPEVTDSSEADEEATEFEYTAPATPTEASKKPAASRSTVDRKPTAQQPKRLASKTEAAAGPAIGGLGSVRPGQAPALKRIRERDAIRRPADQHHGVGAGEGGDRYATITDNPFRQVIESPLSTFSIDVDTAAYANTRRFLLENNMIPPAGVVRIEEMINYFSYTYDSPTKSDTPFATHVEVADCPWQPKHRLVRVGIKGKEINNKERPVSNLVFLLDVSGSMQSSDKLPLLKSGMLKLVDQLGENDRVAIVVYAGASGLVLPSTPATDKQTIREAIERLQSGGSTAGGAGIKLAYQVAVENFIKGGTNRVILGTDGDFNVGTSNTAELTKLVEEKAKSGVFLSVLGFGRGNLNDAMMEEISNKGNGNYAYIDTEKESAKVLVEQTGGTLVTIAKDVKIQIEFNPSQVASYRLIGYANRMLKKEDFNDDKKDAGEIGAGHTVTALYEIVPAGTAVVTATAEAAPAVDDLKFQSPRTLNEAADSDQLLFLKIRYKQPDGDTSQLLTFDVKDAGQSFNGSSADFKFASAVAAFGMLLRNSEHKGDANYQAIEEIAATSKGDDQHGYRAEFVEMVRRAKDISARTARAGE